MSILNQLLRRAQVPGFAVTIQPAELIMTIQACARLGSVQTVRCISPALNPYVSTLLPSQVIAVLDAHKRTRGIAPAVLHQIHQRVNFHKNHAPLAHLCTYVTVLHCSGFHHLPIEEIGYRVHLQGDFFTSDDVARCLVPLLAVLPSVPSAVEEIILDHFVRIPSTSASPSAQSKRLWTSTSTSTAAAAHALPFESSGLSPKAWRSIERTVLKMRQERYPAIYESLREALTQDRIRRGEGFDETFLARGIPMSVLSSNQIADVVVRFQEQQGIFDCEENREKIHALIKWLLNISSCSSLNEADCSTAVQLCSIAPALLREDPNAVAARPKLLQNVLTAVTSKREGLQWALPTAAAAARWGAIGPPLQKEEWQIAADLLAAHASTRTEWMEVEPRKQDRVAERMAWRLLLSKKN